MAGITSVSDTDVQLCEHCSRCNTKLRINIYFFYLKRQQLRILNFFMYMIFIKDYMDFYQILAFRYFMGKGTWKGVHQSKKNMLVVHFLSVHSMDLQFECQCCYHCSSPDTFNGAL